LPRFFAPDLRDNREGLKIFPLVLTFLRTVIGFIAGVLFEHFLERLPLVLQL
jgi:hypothetical protein